MSELVVWRRVAVRGPHGLGKTALAALLVLWFASTREAAGVDWKVPTTASAWRHLSLYLWPEIHKWAQRVKWHRLGLRVPRGRDELMNLQLRLSFGAASAVASSDPVNIEGAHADSLLYLLDEGKAIPAGTWDAVEGAFAGGRSDGLPEAFALAVSTPGAPAGRFYDIHARKPGLEDWWVRHVTVDEAVAAGRVSQEWVDQRARQWLVDSAVYQNRVLGEFAASDSDAVVPLAWVEAAVERWHAWVDAGRPVVESGRQVLGVDVARSGADKTVFAFRAGDVVTGLVEHAKRDTMAVTGLVQAALTAAGSWFGTTGVPTPVVDTVGVGAGVYDRLRELGYRVMPFTGSAGTKVRDSSAQFGFTNVRSAALWTVREALDPAGDSQVALPPDDMLLGDLTAPRWSITTGVPPKIRVEAKEDVAARLGRSPDWGDAVAMALFADQLRGRSQHAAAVGVLPATSPSPLGAAAYRVGSGSRRVSGLSPLG